MDVQGSILTAVLLMMLCVSLSDAWLFWRNYRSAKANGKDLKMLKEIWKTILTLHILRTVYYILTVIQGQRFINASEPCIASELVSWYERETMSCHDFTHFAFKALSRCYMRSGFCEAIRSDMVNFATIYRPKHLFSLGALKQVCFF
ncbi:stanniocalcin-like protein [Elysia marginata]|uniref:Stanniocalcin-like protein n=1 Tax=Elysia marginata TaxID=1093978 RepID=A0AAV4H271_9GAST|nr:stanniocalcin-like protein [Elysia marginata]